MTFTYDLASEDDAELNISRMRLELGDTSSNNGVKPNGENFTDEELAFWLSEEDDHVFHAVIRACDALARLWSLVVTEQTGPRRMEYGKVADNWKAQAQSLRDQYGNPIGGGGGTAFAVSSARTDGYSEHAEEYE